MQYARLYHKMRNGIENKREKKKPTSKYLRDEYGKSRN